MAKFFVIDRNGNRHTRDTRSSGRTYTHAVVHHYGPLPSDGVYQGRGPKSVANWHGSLALAQKSTRSPHYGNPDGYEILAAQIAVPKSKAHPVEVLLNEVLTASPKPAKGGA